MAFANFTLELANFTLEHVVEAEMNHTNFTSFEDQKPQSLPSESFHVLLVQRETPAILSRCDTAPPSFNFPITSSLSGSQSSEREKREGKSVNHRCV